MYRKTLKISTLVILGTTGFILLIPVFLALFYTLAIVGILFGVILPLISKITLVTFKSDIFSILDYLTDNTLSTSVEDGEDEDREDDIIEVGDPYVHRDAFKGTLFVVSSVGLATVKLKPLNEVVEEYGFHYKEVPLDTFHELFLEPTVEQILDVFKEQL